MWGAEAETHSAGCLADSDQTNADYAESHPGRDRTQASTLPRISQARERAKPTR